MPAYVVSIFLSSFLVFLVQPLVGKYILPWFGGSPGIWTTCLLFFQLMLVAGYAYAHLLTTRLRKSRQVVVHLSILGLSFLFLPMIPSSNWRSATVDHPILSILFLLFCTVGFLYLVLAASAPLLQSWFCISYPDRSPYRLYAVSNVASIGALLAYPLIVEQVLFLRQQCEFWSWLYIAYTAGCGICGFMVYRQWMHAHSHQEISISETAIARQHLIDKSYNLQTNDPIAASITDRILWIVLSAYGTVMLMATTNQMTQDVAPVPFLWILPLCLYLLTFIICFDRPEWFKRDVYTWLFIVSIITLAAVSFVMLKIHLYWQIAVYSLNLFTACMCCHGELVLRRPAPRKLTQFYLSIAVGGALGGCLIAILAPAVFNNYHEFRLSNIAVILLLLLCRRTTQIEQLAHRFGPMRMMTMGLAATAGIFGLLVLFPSFDQQPGSSAVLATDRNFYGVIQIKKIDSDNPSRARITMSHGTTMHGFQFMNHEKARTPTSYYMYDSGVGISILHHPKRQSGEPMKIGVIGLGAGTLAAYARPNDDVVFYEINPLVIRLCDQYFTFRQSAQSDGARISVRLGDARLLLEQELANSGSRQYDVLVVDAFSSDSIPVHLLTRECFDLYWQHLAPGGVLAVHVSNRHVNLQPVMYQHAQRRHIAPLFIKKEDKSSTDPADTIPTPSEWILMTPDSSLKRQFLSLNGVAEIDGRHQRKVPEWTDNYSSLWALLR
jgi:hypothetical protein